MPQQDTTPIKEKIISFLKTNGPSLPVPIAREAGQSPLFASAFLSELLSEKKLKISNMKVGTSPIYFIPGQEPQLEKYSQHLNSKQKEAFDLLKQKKFLRDSEQHPAIRVALRSLHDFAFHFKHNEEIIWRYLTSKENEFDEGKKKKEIKKEGFALINKRAEGELNRDSNRAGGPSKAEQNLQKKNSENPKPKPQEKSQDLNIFDKPKQKKTKKKKSQPQKPNQKFFNKIKQHLQEKSIEIIDITAFTKNELFLHVKKEKEFLIVAFNKKRITESDLTKAYKKAKELNLQFTILSKGEQTKKLIDFIRASKSLRALDRFE